jgi:ribosomal protein L16 Arg81 hydroxylase
MVSAISRRGSFGLKQLIHPLSTAYFWSHAARLNGGYVSHGHLRRFGHLISTSRFTDVYGIIRDWRSPILALSNAGAIRVSITPDQAQEFYEAGFRLYFRQAQEAFPKLLSLRRHIAIDFGIADEDVSFELFASPANSGYPAHFDPEINFNILLSGRKRWWLAENQAFTNPTGSFVLTDRRNVPEELRVAQVAAVPRSLNWRGPVYCRPGSCVYLPRGCWHKTYALEPTVSLSCAVLPPTWLSLLVAYVSQALNREHPWRDYALGYSTSSTAILSDRVVDFKRVVQGLDARHLGRILRA